MPYKAAHNRSRHGCTQCRTKKIKCDQRKPGCVRCEENGVRCPGYAMNLRWAPKNQLHQKSSIATTRRKAQTSQDSHVHENLVSEPGSSAVEHMSPDHAEIPDPADTRVSVPNSGDFGLLSDLGSYNFPNEINDFDCQGPFFEVYHHENHEQLTDLSEWPFLESSASGRSLGIDEGLTWEEPPNQEGSHFQSQNRWQDAEDQSQIRNSGPPIRRILPNSTRPKSPQGVLASSRPRQIINIPTALSDYFMKEVIPLYCAWDSASNLMRVLVERTWQSSALLYHTMQSMAAACLANSFPELSPIATRERFEAMNCLQENSAGPKPEQEVWLLANILLGHTASWHNPANLAKESFQTTQLVLRDWVPDPDARALIQFFQAAVDYWGMLLSFLTDTPSCPEPGNGFIGPEEYPEQKIPHPFTGLSDQTIRILTDIGKLVFRYRKKISAIRFMTEQDVNFFKETTREARYLERKLLAYKPQNLSDVLDPGDPQTTLLHLSKMDEAYRCVGLLQIYRVFPDLLAERYNPWDRESIFRIQPPSKEPTMEEKNGWLTSLALHIISLLREIPFESRTRCLQPFMLVAVSSELRRSSQDATDLWISDGNARELGNNAIEVARARNFVKARLSAYTDVLPLRKIFNIVELIAEIWSTLDSEEQEVYWLDICTKKHLGTLMG